MSRKRLREEDVLSGEIPGDEDFSISPSKRPRRSVERSSRSKKRSKKRTYGESEGEDDITQSDGSESFSDSEPPSPVEINPSTGRSIRRATKAAKSYQEPDSEEEFVEEEETKPKRSLKRKVEETEESEPEDIRPSKIIVLKLPSHKFTLTQLGMPRRSSRARSAPRSVTSPTSRPNSRRSRRISHDETEPLIALTDSGRHEQVVRPGSATPEPQPVSYARKAIPTTSTIMEVSQENSGEFEAGFEEEEEEEEEVEEVEKAKAIKGEEDEEGEEEEEETGREGGKTTMDRTAVEDSDDELPVAGRSKRRRFQPAIPPSSATEPAPSEARRQHARRQTLDTTSDFDPAEAEEPEDDDAMSTEESGSPRKIPNPRHSDVSSGERRSSRLATKAKSQAVTSESDERDELHQELEELKGSNRRSRRRKRSVDILYDQPAKRRARVPVNYNVTDPARWAIDMEDDGPPLPGLRGNKKGFRSLLSTVGIFGGTTSQGGNVVGAIDSDSSDDEMQAIRPTSLGGVPGVTPTRATAPDFGRSTDKPGAAVADFGRVKSRKAIADIDPLGVPQDIDFDSVGGMKDHINRLKEMVMLPLFYPQLYQRFGVTPPRGVLFHGPPGTGKTLLARALASHVSIHGHKVTFYMRKGADILNKYVGEAERQLRGLFDEARRTQPSIIFFDEIDGLAPVRSSRQDQIHSTLVTTLLALMDGMDGRGQVVVIGATNRPDSVDPALRRPGRFDREFYFPLPDEKARREIIDIHTRTWQPPLEPKFKDQLASLTQGYGGADLRALCTEAALNAVQGTFPQIYQSNERLVIDPNKIKILAEDFTASINQVVPASKRSGSASASPLDEVVRPLLADAFQKISAALDEMLPPTKKLNALEEAEYRDRNEDDGGFDRQMMQKDVEFARVFRPRMLVYGVPGMGQQHIGQAILHKFERLHVQSFALSAIFNEGHNTEVSTIVRLFDEAVRHKPSIIYIPDVELWWKTISETARNLFLSRLRSLPPHDPVLVLGVTDVVPNYDKPDEIPKPTQEMLRELFGFSTTSHIPLARPDKAKRREFFSKVIGMIEAKPTDFPDPDARTKRKLPELAKASPAPPPPPPTKEEERAQRKKDRTTLSQLSLNLDRQLELYKKCRRFMNSAIPEKDILYLFDEQDPARVTTDIPEQRHEERPFEMSRDKNGVEGIREVATGKFYYNLDLRVIERRTSNGYYKRPVDFYEDIKRMVKDARTLGNEERILDANLMLANADVNLHNYEILPELISLGEECEAVYRRELERQRRAQHTAQDPSEEGQEMHHIESNIPPSISKANTLTTEGSGPIVLGAPLAGRQAVPVSRQQPLLSMSSLSNGNISHGMSNGYVETPDPLQEDVPSSESPEVLVAEGSNAPNTESSRAQKSALTPLAEGSQAKDYHNSASTTSSAKTKPTPSSNGVQPELDLSGYEKMSGGSQLANTQSSPEYLSSSHSSQGPPQHEGPTPGSTANGRSVGAVQMMPPPPTTRPQPSIGNLLNTSRSETVTGDARTTDTRSAPLTTTTLATSVLPQPQLILNKGRLRELHESITKQTSGFSVEQLEQTNAALTRAVWAQRHQWNRDQVVHNVTEVFNREVRDILEMQRVLKMSQETN